MDENKSLDGFPIRRVDELDAVFQGLRMERVSRRDEALRSHHVGGTLRRGPPLAEQAEGLGYIDSDVAE